MIMNSTGKTLYQIPFCHFVPSPLDLNYSYGDLNSANEPANQTFASGDDGYGSGDEVTMITIHQGTLPTNLHELSLWASLSQDCQLSTLIMGVVGLVLLILGLTFNMILISASHATQQRPPIKKSDSAATKKREDFAVTLLVTKYFRCSVGTSFILASVLLLLLTALSGYETMYSNFHYLAMESSGVTRLKVYKMASCVVFHAALSSALFAMLGSMVERCRIICGINPGDYLEKVNYLMSGPSNRLRSHSRDVIFSSKKSNRKVYVLTYLVLVWIVSIGFGVVTVVYSEVQFLLFAELYNNQNYLQFFFLLRVPNDTKVMATSIIYVVFIFLPLFLLILSLSFTVWFLLKTNEKAKKIESYNEAKFKSLSTANGELPFNHKLLQLTQSSNSKGDVREETNESAGTSAQEERPRVAEYSHRMEHEQQVTLNCQETGLNGIQTDSIQVTVDPASDAEDADAKTPPPPDWLKFSSMSRARYSDNPAIHIDDLANSSLAVSVDSARCFFGETNETRSVLIASSIVSLFTMPLCAVIAIDVYANRHSIFRSDPGRSSLNGSLFNSMIISSIGVCALALFLFGGILPFIIFYCTSTLFKDATKRMCDSKSLDEDSKTLTQSHPSASTLPKSSQSTSRNAINGVDTNGSHSQRRLWSSKRPHSLDIEGWRPEERPTSDAFPENRLDIDRRFDLEEEEDE